MKQSIINWAVFAVAALVAGPIAGWLVEMARAADGGTDPTALLSASPVIGVALYAGAFLVAAAVGTAAARVAHASIALASVGVVLAWVAWRTARIDDVFRFGGDGSAWWTLAIEGLMMASGGVAVGAVILWSASKRAPDQKHEFDGLLSGHTLAGVVAGLVAGLMAAWALARSDAVGQTFAAAVGAGIAAAVVGRVVSVRAPVLAFIAAGSLLAFAGPAIGAIMSPPDPVQAAYAGSLIPIARVMPIDWIAGVFIGVPIGVTWANGMVHKHASTG